MKNQAFGYGVITIPPIPLHPGLTWLLEFHKWVGVYGAVILLYLPNFVFVHPIEVDQGSLGIMQN